VDDTPANLPTRRVVVGLLAIVALVAGCADSSKVSDVDEALALLRSAEPAERYEAVVRLGTLPPSEARRNALAGAVRDGDETVRLMAAIVVIGDGPTEHASWLRSRRATPAPSTPNPSPRENLSPIEELVYLDPWFAGTLLPGLLVAARTGDERVRTLGLRALKYARAQAADEDRRAK
jgi:hypothetical protein